MQCSFDWSVELILWMQQFSPELDVLFLFFTSLGSEDFFMACLPFIYWCVDRRAGARLTVLFLLSAYVNFAAKILADMPRPFEYSSRVRALTDAYGGGFPSGHTQGSTVLWGFLAWSFAKTWVRVVAAVCLVMVPLSRVYLGLHFPVDIAGGYLIGVAMLALFLVLAAPVERILARIGFWLQLGLIIAGASALLLLYPGMDADCASVVGALTGMAAGFCLERRFVRFDTRGSILQRGMRLLLGLAVLVVIRAGLKAVFSGLEPELAFRFIRYGAVGLWGSWGAPYLFRRLRIG